MKWALVDSQNKVSNVIAYDGESPYEPPAGLNLREVNNWVDLGMDADIPFEQVPKPIPKSPAVQKAERNNIMKMDLAVVAGYDIARKANPQLVFSDYLDSLEVIRDSIPSTPVPTVENP